MHFRNSDFCILVYNIKFVFEKIAGGIDMKGRKLYKGILVLFAGFFITAVAALSFGTIFSSAHEAENNVQYKYYKSIEIQSGDTLWEIAEETMTSEYDSVSEYVDALKEMNGLASDEIQSGQYLMIAYNDTELK